MTETSRIRWEDKTPGNSDVYNVASIGYVGTRPESAFIIYTPDELHADWLLSVRLTPGSQFFYAASRDELKDRAGRWLEEFTSSLGAIFPGAVAADLRFRADEMESYVGGGDEGRHDRSMFATGMRRSADLIEHGDVPATSATEAGKD